MLSVSSTTASSAGAGYAGHRDCKDRDPSRGAVGIGRVARVVAAEDHVQGQDEQDRRNGAAEGRDADMHLLQQVTARDEEQYQDEDAD